MKSSSLTTKLITAAFSLAVLVYFFFQMWNYFTAPETTVAVYAYSAERTLALSGFVVRDESVVDCSDPLVELTRTEGERVSKGASLAVVYGSAQSLADAQELAALRTQLEQLQYARQAARDAETALRLDSEVESDIITLRASLAAGNYAALDSDAAALKNTVLRREYAYRGGGDLSGRIEALEEQIKTLSGSLGSVSRRIAAPYSGTYSAVADGWENVLSPHMLSTLTPAQFKALVPEPVSSTVGKLVRGDRWYYAAVIDDADAGSINVSRSYSLLISGADAPLPVTVSSLSESQNGRRLLVLTSESYLASVTMLRAQNAELVLENYTGLRIPKNALRIGEDGATGVYCRIGRQCWFKPVELLYQGEDYCLVRPGEIHAARDNDLVFYTLRAGDEAIITANELYNGKVIN